MKSKDTKRTSFDLSNENAEKLKEFSEAMGSNYSNVMNYLLRVVVGASPEIKRELAGFCNNKIKDISEKAEGMSAFEKQDALEIQRMYQELAYFFSVGLTALETRKESMKKVYLKEGYLLIPNSPDWIILDNISRPEDCMYAGVVETREPLDGSKKYHAKHFVFFSNIKYGRDYTNDFKDKIYSACCDKDPSFKQILNNVVIPDYNGQKEVVSNMVNIDAYKAAPCPGLYHIVEYGDPLYWNKLHPDYEPPYGCEIIRNNETEPK